MLFRVNKRLAVHPTVNIQDIHNPTHPIDITFHSQVSGKKLRGSALLLVSLTDAATVVVVVNKVDTVGLTPEPKPERRTIIKSQKQLKTSTQTFF